MGGEDDTPVAAQFTLEKKFPDLIIAGLKGQFPKEQSSDEELVAAINRAKPDVLLVALGHPDQEKWIYHNLDKIPSVKLAIGVGGALDFISGKLRRAPRWMRSINLEWLFRLIQEPKRLKRIRRAVLDFPKIMYREKIDEIEKTNHNYKNYNEF